MRFCPPALVGPRTPSTLDYSPKAYIEIHLDRLRVRVDDAPCQDVNT